MASRRDQLQSYQFRNHRVISALVMRETDPAQSPLRRGVGALFAGAMVMIIVATGFGIYGLLTRIGDRDWKEDGAVVVEKETGSTYVHQSGVLHPTLNLTSALLASGRAPFIVRVSRKALVGVPRGRTLGIDKAPDSLPELKALLTGDWTFCSVRGAAVSGGEATPESEMIVGVGLAGLRPIGETALVVQAGSTVHVVWNGHRHEVREPGIVLPSLFRLQRPVIRVDPAWLNGLVQGVAIAPIAVPGEGTPSRVAPNRKVGELLQAETGNGAVYAIVFDDGVAQITDLQKAIYVGSGATPVPISIAALQTLPESSRLPAPPDDVAPPLKAPQVTEPVASDRVCVSSNPTGPPVVSVGGVLPGRSTVTETKEATGEGGILADRVVVPSGRAALVRVVQAPGDFGNGAFALVNDSGLRYPVGRDALGFLGLPESAAVGIPAALVNSLPAGPTLDPVAARRPVDMTAQPVTDN